MESTSMDWVPIVTGIGQCACLPSALGCLGRVTRELGRTGNSHPLSTASVVCKRGRRCSNISTRPTVVGTHRSADDFAIRGSIVD